jgi:hypothetical protein
MTDPGAGERIPRSAMLLGLLCVLPLAAAAAGAWLDRSPSGAARWLATGLVAGAVLLAFSGGMRWGSAIGPYSASRRARDFSLAALAAVAAGVALLVPPVIGASLLLAGHLLLALWDLISAQAGHLPLWPARLRMLLTALAVPALLALLGKLLFVAAA